MDIGAYINGIIIGIILVKVIEYKLKKSSKYHNFMKKNKLMRILNIIKENDNKSN